MKILIAVIMFLSLAGAASAQVEGHIIQGKQNIFWGENAADSFYRGDFNLCLGHDSCKTLLTANCHVSIIAPDKKDLALYDQITLPLLGYALALAEYQDTQCHDNQNRKERTAVWLKQLTDLVVVQQKENYKLQ